MDANLSNSRSLSWYVFLLPSIGIIIYALLSALGIVSYINGVNPHFFMSTVILPWIISFIVLLLLLIKALSMIPKREKWLLPLGVILVTIFIAVGSYYFKQSSSLSKNMFLKGLHKRMQSYDSTTIRTWLKEDPIFKDSNTHIIKENEWPDTIKKMQPDEVYFRQDDKSLMFVWKIMRELDDLFVISSDEKRPIWLPSQAEKFRDGYFLSRIGIVR